LYYFIIPIALHADVARDPGHKAFATPDAQEAYTRIFALLLWETVPFLLSGRETAIRNR
jgi:hypothetical protein